MKRGAPMVRRTPLKPGKPLVTRTPLKTRIPLRSRTAIAPVSAKRLIANRARTVVVSAMRDVTDGRCVRCGDAWDVAGHERLGRAQGGDILAPDALLCSPCNGWCEDEPILAAFHGWKISGKHPHDPELAIGQARRLDGVIVDFTVPAEVLA